MGSPRKTRLVCVFSLLLAPLATAADMVSLTDRAADAAAQALVDRALAQHLQSGPAIATVLASSSVADQQFRQTILAEQQLGSPQPLTANGMEINTHIATDKLSNALVRIAAQYLPQFKPTNLVIADSPHTTITAIAQIWDAPRSWCDVPGWRHCQLHQIEWVKAAAALDYRQQLMSRLGQLRVSSQQNVAGLLLRHPKFANALKTRVGKLSIPNPVLEPVGLCRVHTELNRGQVIELLASAAADTGEPLNVDFTGIIEPGFQDPLTVDGLAVAPPIEAAAPVIHQTRPRWADRFLTAKAIGHPPTDLLERLQRQEMATTAARIEARRQLWIELEQQPWPAGGTIGDLLTRHPQGSATIAAIHAAMIPVAAPEFDSQDNATVTLGLPLERVWQILQSVDTTR